MDDIAGGPIWSLPIKNDNRKKEYIKDLRNSAKSIISGEESFLDEFSSLDKLSNNSEVSAMILYSLADSVELMGKKECVLFGHYQDSMLFGFCLDPMTRKILTTQIDVKKLMLIENSEAQIIKTILGGWSRQMNAVICWEAIQALCDVDLQIKMED